MDPCIEHYGLGNPLSIVLSFGDSELCRAHIFLIKDWIDQEEIRRATLLPLISNYLPEWPPKMYKDNQRPTESSDGLLIYAKILQPSMFNPKSLTFYPRILTMDIIDGIGGRRTLDTGEAIIRGPYRKVRVVDIEYSKVHKPQFLHVH